MAIEIEITVNGTVCKAAIANNLGQARELLNEVENGKYISNIKI